MKKITFGDLGSQRIKNGETVGGLMKAARKIGDNVTNIQNQLISEFQKGEGANQGKINALMIKYRNAMAIQELFVEMVRSLFSMTRRLIQRLAL